MQAARIPHFGPPDVFTLDDIPRPTLGAAEALVRIKACGVNRMDTELRAGVYGGLPLSDFFFGQHIELPHIPGIEPAGLVEAINGPAFGIEPGMRVVPHSHLSCGVCVHCRAGFDNACPHIRVLGVQTPGCGGYAEYFAWPTSHLIPFSAALSFTQAAALLVNYGPVWFGLIERARLRAGETVVVTGAAGGCGHAALDIARLIGARAIAVTRSADKVAALKAAGAESVIVDQDGEDWSRAVLELTAGRGAHVVLELVGAATWQNSIRSAASRGRILVIGSHTGLSVALNIGELFGKNLSIEGITRANFAAMSHLVELAGQGRLKPHVEHVFPLAQVADAHRLMDASQHIGKIVLTMS